MTRAYPLFSNAIFLPTGEPYPALVGNLFSSNQKYYFEADLSLADQEDRATKYGGRGEISRRVAAYRAYRL